MTQAPPVYAMAWTSSLFRPLSYLGRTLIGTMAMMAVVAALVVVVIWAF